MERMLKYFFLAGHVQYARYLTQYLLEMRHLPADAKRDQSCVRCICVSTPRGVLECCLWRPIWRGDNHQHGQMSSERHELVREWIDAFQITVHVTDQVDCIYSANVPCPFEQKQHREEQRHRRVLDANDRALVDKEVAKHPHPLQDKRRQSSV